MTTPSSGGEGAGHLESLVLWPQFTGTEWQLPTDVPVAARLLVGWRFSPDPIDAGPPPAVAALLVAALRKHATLTFASANGPSTRGTVPSAGWRLERNLVWTTSTTDDEATQGIFHEDSFPWTLQGQVVILGRPGVPLALDERHLQLQNDLSLFVALKSAGANGVVLPGVDGAVVGLYFFDAAVAGAVQSELDRMARAVGAGCVIAAGADFGSQLRA